MPMGGLWWAQMLWGKSKIVGPRTIYSSVLVGPKLFDREFVCPKTHQRLFGGPWTKRSQIGGLDLSRPLQQKMIFFHGAEHILFLLPQKIFFITGKNHQPSQGKEKN